MTNEPDERISSGYDAFYEAWGKSPTLRRIWRDEVTGPDFPEDFAHISFLPLAQLEELTAGLALQPGQLLVDLACGAGGPGLYAARETGARLIGVDLSPVAVERARERAPGLGLADRATFAQGSFDATGFATGEADAAMTVDALQYAPDKRAALVEVARIVRTGGRFAFVAFELDADKVEGMGVWEDPVGDYRPLLDEVGFDVLSYEPIPGWRESVTAGFGAAMAESDALTAELGEAAATALGLEAAVTLQLDPYCGHVLVIAQRRR